MKTRFFRNSILTVCLLPALALAHAQPGTARPVLVVAPPPPPMTRAAQQAAGPLTLSPNYVIGASDQIRIDVRIATDTGLNVVDTESGTQTVRPDGQITIPLVGDIQAAGFTPPQLAADITARITHYYLSPIVTVT
ncbi:MAG TPA: polysaccharide biosynthesis/export family protein, partial [Acidobacteriaceae bacterium]|nr:polysaccharide biosynthesis/export family protein [Acidobacteriaceae bacterium]